MSHVMIVPKRLSSTNADISQMQAAIAVDQSGRKQVRKAREQETSISPE